MKRHFLPAALLLFCASAQSGPLTYQGLQNLARENTEASNNYSSGYYRGANIRPDGLQPGRLSAHPATLVLPARPGTGVYRSSDAHHRQEVPCPF